MAESRINVQEAKVGMVVTRQVVDMQGRIIINEGARLTPSHVKRLEKWGVSELFVDLDNTEDSPKSEAPPPSQDLLKQLDQKYMQQMAEVFNLRFSQVEEDPVMQELKKIAFKRVVLEGRNKLPGIKLKT